jgi:hypothetical protein
LRRRRRTWRRWRTRGRSIVGVVDAQATTAEVVAVEATDGVGRFGVGTVLDEREAA